MAASNCWEPHLGVRTSARPTPLRGSTRLRQSLTALEDNAQGGFALLRQCGSWCKLVYSSRTVPP
eukprot:11772866-Karenia_brevis.AAC.1